jgi:glycine/D-amino acid oxidase-like deaminating enzyme
VNDDYALPRAASIVVVGAGVHGLSAAYHVSELLAEAGKTVDVLVLEKSRIGGGASGVSGGIVRNFYLSQAMNEIVRQSVEILEVDPELFGFRQVGYIAVVPELQARELEQIAAQHASVGYQSELFLGETASRTYMRQRFADWSATGATAVLHEERSGWADAQRTLTALAGMTRSYGARVLEGVEVLAFEYIGDAVASVVTSHGAVECDVVVIAPGPWARDLWTMLGLATSLDLDTDDGPDRADVFHYWLVREGEFHHSRAGLEPRAPVVHLDVDVPLLAEDGAVLVDSPWGIYFRPGLGGGVACGGLPLPLDEHCPLDPYGPSHVEYGRPDPAFHATTTAALDWALSRFRAREVSWSSTTFAAPTCFTPDSHPIVGFVRENVYALLDSNHGFKLLALGKLGAAEIVSGARCAELDPFRMERFSANAVHPVSSSPYPWT